jgi:hemoglobin/transferrin/lactoferrin receptor protein
MNIKTVLAFLILIVWVPVQVFAQDDTENGDGQLPPVVVEADDGNELPPIVVQPDANSFNDQNYPDLSNSFLGNESPFDLSEGVLRGATSLFDTPAAAGITSRRDITEKQSSDMFSALQNEVGVLMQSTAAGQASPFVRGLTGQQVLILVDGIRLNNSVYRFGPNQYFNTIDPGSVDHIEVLRGQGSVLWGSDAIGGAINVVTRGADSHLGMFHDGYRQGSATQHFNTANSGSYTRFNVEGWVGQSGLFAGGSYSNINDLDTGYNFGRQPGTNYSQFSGDVKYNYMIDDQQLVTISLQHFEQEGVPRSDRFPGFPGDLNNSNTNGNARFFDPQQRDLAYIRYQALDPIPLLDALTVTGSYHRQREIQTRGIPEVRSQETDVETVGVNVVGVRDMCELGKVTVGADWYHDDADSNFTGTASGPIIPDDAYYERLGVFLNWDVQVTDRLNAIAGVRYETIDLAATADVGGPVFISPSYDDFVGQVGFSYKLTPCARLVGSISEGFRAPNLDELTANNPNVLQDGQDLPSLGLTPEHSVNYEIGIKTDFHNLRTQTFVFWTDLDDNIVPISAGSNQFRRANQDSFVQGVEFQGEYLLDCGWSAYGNFWYTYGRNDFTGDPLSRIPPMQGIAGLRWRDPESLGHFAIYTWLVDNQDRLDPVRDFGDERIPVGGTPGYGTLNMQFSRTFGQCNQHHLSVNLENLTDRAYLVHGSGVFGTGFTARLGYSLDF